MLYLTSQLFEISYLPASRLHRALGYWVIRGFNIVFTGRVFPWLNVHQTLRLGGLFSKQSM